MTLDTAPGEPSDISGLRKYSCDGGIGNARQNLCNKSWINHAFEPAPLLYLWTLQVSDHALVLWNCVSGQRCITIAQKVIRWWRIRQGKPWLSEANSILTKTVIFLPLYHALSLFLVVCSSHLSLCVLSCTPLADRLTGSVPLANRSALIMRIISSHHSPRNPSSISSGLFSTINRSHKAFYYRLSVCGLSTNMLELYIQMSHHVIRYLIISMLAAWFDSGPFPWCYVEQANPKIMSALTLMS